MVITKKETLEDIHKTLSKIKKEIERIEKSSDSGRMFIYANELQQEVSMLFYSIGSIDTFDYGIEDMIKEK